MLNINQASVYLGVAIVTLRRWEKEGKLIPNRSAGGHRRYEESQLVRFKSVKKEDRITVGYCRVSLADQKNDLKRQVVRVGDYCAARGYQFEIIEDLGSGLNYNKKGLKKLISMICAQEVDRIVMNYRDRLIRFGFEMVEQLCEIYNVEIEVINHTEDKSYEEELVEDVLSVITVFSAKLYGSRSHKLKKITETNQALFKLVELEEASS